MQADTMIEIIKDSRKASNSEIEIPLYKGKEKSQTLKEKHNTCTNSSRRSACE